MMNGDLRAIVRTYSGIFDVETTTPDLFVWLVILWHAARSRIRFCWNRKSAVTNCKEALGGWRKTSQWSWRVSVTPTRSVGLSFKLGRMPDAQSVKGST